MNILCRRIAIAGFGLWAAVSAAQAQVGNDHDGDDCRVFVDDSEGEGRFATDVCSTAYLSRQSSIRVAGVLQQVLRNSFGFGPATVEPAGLSGLIADDAARRLSPSTIFITPTAADAAAAEALTTRLNVWADGRVLYTDYVREAGDLDGPTVSLLAGFDYKLTSKLTLGLLLSTDNSQFESAINDLNSRSIGAGPYMGLVLSDNLVLSASLIGSRINSDQAFGLLDFDTSRVQASTGINGYWYKDTWRFNPGVTLSLSKDWEEEQNGFIGDRTIELGLLTPSLQIGNTLQLSDTVTMEPWAGYAFDWTFHNRTHSPELGTITYSNIDLRLMGGLNFGLGGNAQLAITGEAGGLFLGELDSYSIEANLAVQF